MELLKNFLVGFLFLAIIGTFVALLGYCVVNYGYIAIPVIIVGVIVALSLALGDVIRNS